MFCEIWSIFNLIYSAQSRLLARPDDISSESKNLSLSKSVIWECLCLWNVHDIPLYWKIIFLYQIFHSVSYDASRQRLCAFWDMKNDFYEFSHCSPHISNKYTRAHNNIDNDSIPIKCFRKIHSDARIESITFLIWFPKNNQPKKGGIELSLPESRRFQQHNRLCVQRVRMGLRWKWTWNKLVVWFGRREETNVCVCNAASVSKRRKTNRMIGDVETNSNCHSIPFGSELWLNVYSWAANESASDWLGSMLSLVK